MKQSDVVELSLCDLEFGRLLDRLASLAKSGLGKDACRELICLGNVEAVTSGLRDTSQMRKLIDADGGPPLGAVEDVREVLGRASKDAALEAVELLSIADVMRTGWMVREYHMGKQTLAEELAERHGRLRGAGSDAHTLGELGRAHVIVTPHANRPEALLAALESCQTVGTASSRLVHLASTWAKVRGRWSR